MAFTYDVNESPATNATAMFQFKTLMKAAGWTVPRSSDGLSFNSSGDQITGVGSGANGMNNSNSWFVLQQPSAVDGYQRQILFFRSTVVQNWWVQYSITAGFTGGGATTPPSATDGQNLLGTGTSGAPLFNSSEGSMRWNMMAENSSPYNFYAIGWAAGSGGNIQNIIMCDRMAGGSFPTQDNDPYVWYMSAYNNANGLVLPRQIDSIGNADVSTDSPMCRADAPSALQSNGTGTGCPFSWYKYGLSGATFVNPTALFYAVNGVSGNVHAMVPCGQGSNPVTGNDDLFPLLWGRYLAQTTPVGYKGTSSLFQWCGAQRATGDTITVSTSSDHIVLNGTLVLPWNGANPLL